MAEKRKLRAGREPAAKRRASEAVTPSQKKKAPTPRVPSPPPPPPEPIEAPLPISIKDGEPVPVLRDRQSATLSDKEYQSYAESAVLLAALERSKKKWLSDGILVRYYTKPKKTKREQIEKNNPPKDSMTRVGPCDVTVGPHLFDAMIYTVKDPNAPPAIQYAPPPKQMVHYGHPGNFQQYQPYPGNQKRPPYPPVPPGRPPHGYPGTHATPSQPRGPNQVQPQPGQRPPGGPAGQPAKPSPDPVIQMLATRAAADPELKALMRVVASSQASQEQLRAFQAHIDELNAIIKAREQQERLRQAAAASTQPAPVSHPATPTPQARPASPQVVIHNKPGSTTNTLSQAHATTPQQAPPAQTPSREPQQEPVSESKVPPTTVSAQPPTPAPPPQPQPQQPAQPQTPAPATSQPGPGSNQTPSAIPTVKQELGTPGPTSTQTAPSNSAQPAVSGPSATPVPVGAPTPNTASQVQSPATQTPQTSANIQQVPRPGPPYPPYQQQAPYGGQTSAQSRPQQYGSPTPYYRPQVPPARPTPTPVNYKSVVFEFTSPLTPYGSSTSGHAGSGDRYLFPEYSILEWLPNENTILASFLIVKKVDPNTPFPIETAPDAGTGRKSKGTSKSKKGSKAEKAADTLPPTDTPQKQEPSEDRPDAKPGQTETSGTPSGKPSSEANLKEYWQPVTFRIHAANPRILEPLTRVVKPADEVRKFMNEVMDRAERAPDGFPAFRLPHEDAREAFEAESTPASTVVTGVSSRSRPLKVAVKPVEEESEAELNAVELKEDEELMDFYGAPTGMPPLRV